MIIYQQPARFTRRRAVLLGTALAIGVALAWIGQPAHKGLGVINDVSSDATSNLQVASAHSAPDVACDARCSVASVIGPATAACATAIGELAGFGVRWGNDGSSDPMFDRFAWLQAAQGTVTLGGNDARFRNAAGALLPVEYDCDFDPRNMRVIEARARPRPETSLSEASR